MTTTDFNTKYFNGSNVAEATDEMFADFLAVGEDDIEFDLDALVFNRTPEEEAAFEAEVEDMLAAEAQQKIEEKARLAGVVYKPTMKKCGRCGGSGYLSQYNHVVMGRCFKCGGAGVC